MPPAKKTYTSPQAGKPLISSVMSGVSTPMLEIKFCNLIKPYYYKNSPSIPRYSITAFLDPIEHKEFIKMVQGIEKSEGVESILKMDTEKDGNEYVQTGKYVIKFNTKDIIPVFVYCPDSDIEKMQPLTLEDELARGEKIVVNFEILRYTKKNSNQNECALSMKPNSVHYYPEG